MECFWKDEYQNYKDEYRKMLDQEIKAKYEKVKAITKTGLNFYDALATMRERGEW